jgi:hypothetical protein
MTAVTRYRITGLSAWGTQWERKDDDKEIARRVLNLLQDRRMLWEDFSLEIMEHCGRSADHARRELGVLIDNPEIGDELAAQVRALQGLFRNFMREIGPYDSEHHWGTRGWRPHGIDPLSMALGRLRGLAGAHIGQLAAQYDLDVSPELASIVPDEDGWFFERFNGGTN